MKYLLASTSLIATALLLTACGGDDNNTNYHSNADIIKFSEIEDRYNDENSMYALRTDYVIRDGQLQTTEKIIKGKGELSDPNEPTMNYFFAPNFGSTYEGTAAEYNSKQIATTIDVLSPTQFSFKAYSDNKNNDKVLTIIEDLKTFDISGVTVDDSKRFDTPLDDFGLTNAKFPEGSICYSFINEKTNFDVFDIWDEEPSFVKSLEEWIETQKKHYKDITVNDIVKVGNNNEYRAVTINRDDKSYRGAVDVAGKIYEADYITTEGTEYNADPDVASVDCERFNDIAADYLEAQIKENGKLKR